MVFFVGFWSDFVDFGRIRTEIVRCCTGSMGFRMDVDGFRMDSPDFGQIFTDFGWIWVPNPSETRPNPFKIHRIRQKSIQNHAKHPP